MTVWGQLLLSLYNSRGIKDQPRTSHLLPPTERPGLCERPRRGGGQRAALGSLANISFFRVPFRLRGVGRLENSAGSGQGCNGKPGLLSRCVSPGCFHQSSRGDGLFKARWPGPTPDATRPGGARPPAGGRRGGGRCPRRQPGSGGRCLGAPSLPGPGRGGHDTQRAVQTFGGHSVRRHPHAAAGRRGPQTTRTLPSVT